PGSSLYCFDPFFSGYFPSTVGYVNISPYYPGHHHHHHRPYIHPPSPTVAAKGVPGDKHVALDFKRIDSKHAANWSGSSTTRAHDGASPVHVSGNGFTQSRSNSSASFSTHNSGSPSAHASSGGASPSYSNSGHSSASFSSGGSVSHSSGGPTSAGSSGGSVSH